MYLAMASLTVLSLNCHGFDIGTSLYLHSVASDMDITLLQETWLCDATCFRLNYAFGSFTVYHSSVVEQKFAMGVSSGRPFGGTAVLVNKRLSKQTFQLVTDNPRLTAIRCQMSNSNDVIIGSVYMPFNDGSLQCCIEFESVIGVMQELLDTGLDCKFVFGGDFNVSKLSVNNSFETFDDFCHANRMVCLDHVHDGIDYTFHNDVSKRYALIDHFICSPELTDSSVAGHVLDDEEYNTSDHLAITCEFVTAGAWVKSTMPKTELPSKETVVGKGKFRFLPTDTA